MVQSTVQYSILYSVHQWQKRQKWQKQEKSCNTRQQWQKELNVFYSYYYYYNLNCVKMYRYSAQCTSSLNDYLAFFCSVLRVLVPPERT